MSPSVKTTAVSVAGAALMEAVQRLPLEHAVTFGLHTTIGILTIVYLCVRIFNSLKHKRT